MPHAGNGDDTFYSSDAVLHHIWGKEGRTHSQATLRIIIAGLFGGEFCCQLGCWSPSPPPYEPSALVGRENLFREDPWFTFLYRLLFKSYFTQWINNYGFYCWSVTFAKLVASKGANCEKLREGSFTDRTSHQTSLVIGDPLFPAPFPNLVFKIPNLGWADLLSCLVDINFIDTFSFIGVRFWNVVGQIWRNK